MLGTLSRRKDDAQRTVQGTGCVGIYLEIALRMAKWTEGKLRLYLRSGSVFYFQDRNLTSPQPHYFIVVNNSPLGDDFLILAVSSSRIEKVKARRQSLPCETLVEVAMGEYSGFTKPSIIDCNYVRRCSRAELLQQLNQGGEQKADLGKEVLGKIREGVLVSPLVERETKKLL